MASLQENKHHFALFVKDLPINQKDIVLQDQEVVHRITHVLRLAVHDTLTVFNNQGAFVVAITSITKKAVTVTVTKKETVQESKPVLTVLLPLLKKEALEEALYACVELGVAHIILVKTAKTHAVVMSPAYHERLQKIVHGAQEQGKQFAPLTLEGPVTLQDAITRVANIPCKLVAVQGGQPLLQHLPKNITAAVLAVGPEADFTQEEKEQLQMHGFKACSLGSTVLRAQQAVTVLVGAVRVLTV